MWRVHYAGAIHRRPASGKREVVTPVLGVEMSKWNKALAVVGIIFGILYFLQSRVGEQPSARIEKPVDANALR
jgi:hypothetical protein